MPSSALQEWQLARAERLDNLLTAHRAHSGSGRGRRWRTESLNWSLTLRLAGEFQGFSRRLHDEAASYLVPRTGNSNLEEILRNSFSAERWLDKGNASASNINKDYLRLGIPLLKTLEQVHPTKKSKWVKTLNQLNDARNAVAHSDDAKLATIKADGFDPGKLATFRSARRNLDGLAIAMDDVIADYLANLLSIPRPW